MTTRITPHALAAAALLAFAVPTAAQVVYQGGPPSGEPGFDIFGEFRTADSFSTAGPLDFAALRFWGIRTDGLGADYTPVIFWQILVDHGGLPGDVFASGTETAAVELRAESAFPGFFSWQFDVAVGARTLGPGNFWLALQDVSAGSGLIWERSLGGSGEFVVEASWAPGAWVAMGEGGLAFELHGSSAVVPEPLSMMLLGTGLVALGALRRRRKRHQASG